MTRLFTVRIVVSVTPDAGNDFRPFITYEADFAGRHFARTTEADLKHWVRICARNTYGKDTQVIFLHEHEGTEQ